MSVSNQESINISDSSLINWVIGQSGEVGAGGNAGARGEGGYRGEFNHITILGTVGEYKYGNDGSAGKPGKAGEAGIVIVQQESEQAPQAEVVPPQSSEDNGNVTVSPEDAENVQQGGSNKEQDEERFSEPIN